MNLTAPLPLIVSDDLIFDVLNERVFLYVHSSYAPAGAAFEKVVEAFHARREKLSDYRHFVLTTGGGPNSQQRAKMKASFGVVEAGPTAIVTDSPIMRFIGSSLSLLMRTNLETFSIGRAADALSYLALSASEQAGVVAWVRAVMDLPEAKLRFPALALVHTALAGSVK